MTEKKKEGAEPEGSPHRNRSSETPRPAAPTWKHKALTATATGLDMTAEILRATGHDGLAETARTTAHLLHLVAIFVGQRGDDQR